ncbi:MAG: response regulator [Rhodomicrobiaceae bacterium]
MIEHRKVLVIDDHPVTHIGCQNLLSELGFDIILEAADCIEGKALVEQERPELAIVDLGLPGIGGLALIEQLHRNFSDLKMMAFSMHDDAVFAAKALEAGAHGFLTKSSSVEQFRNAVETIMAQGIFLEHEMATQLALINIGQSNNPLKDLTRRELQILHYIGEGRSHGEIADELRISYKTVANCATQLKSKLGVKKLPDLMRIAIEHI